MKSSHLGRYKDIGMLLVEHRHAADTASDADPAEMAEDARELATSLEALGPTFVKLGQLLSTRADLLPDPYLHALARLQDDGRADRRSSEVERIVSGELGVRVVEGLRLVRVHPAGLRVARAGAPRRAAGRAAGRGEGAAARHPRRGSSTTWTRSRRSRHFADAHTDAGQRIGFADMVAEFRTSLMAELDYRQEAANLAGMRANLAERATTSSFPSRSPTTRRAGCSRWTSSTVAASARSARSR